MQDCMACKNKRTGRITVLSVRLFVRSCRFFRSSCCSVRHFPVLRFLSLLVSPSLKTSYVAGRLDASACIRPDRRLLFACWSIFHSAYSVLD